jgi:putative metalloprotease
MMKRLLAFAAGALMLVSCSETFNATRALQGGMLAAQALTLSDAQVQDYVHQYITQLDAQSKVLPESNAYTKRLRNLTKGLNAVDDVPLNFKVYQENQVNAFACADGSVRVYTGIMDVMTDNELLGVIGHEIGHVAMKHTKKEMRASMLTSAALEGLASTSDKVAALTDSQLGAIGNAVLNAQYSKKQESQADDYGYEFLKAAGRNPWGMAMSFEKLKSVAGSSGSQATAVQKLFSSHPDTDTRIQRMSERATAEGYKRPAK